MNIGLYRGVSAMDAAERRLEAVTQNLANLRTPGFKAQASAHHAFRVGRPDSGEYGVGTTRTIDLSQGVLERTGNTLDLAFHGEGFFQVEGPAGPLYTRNGSFQLDEQGLLITGDGYPVSWKGAQGTIDAADTPPTVDSRGHVFQGARKVGELELVQFNAPDRLQSVSGGYFLAEPGLAREDATGEIHQGALEGSNATGVDQLVALITVQRSHEMAANVLDLIDQTYQRLSQRR